ncbi:MAG: hypothetical protein LBE20_00240 [Deltaproteobacteria bacterium]|jgi:hypothetical protein|nr:hypothetical protein [Deltaproteobacteria bacterium]
MFKQFLSLTLCVVFSVAVTACKKDKPVLQADATDRIITVATADAERVRETLQFKLNLPKDLEEKFLDLFVKDLNKKGEISELVKSFLDFDIKTEYFIASDKELFSSVTYNVRTGKRIYSSVVADKTLFVDITGLKPVIHDIISSFGSLTSEASKANQMVDVVLKDVKWVSTTADDIINLLSSLSNNVDDALAKTALQLKAATGDDPQKVNDDLEALQNTKKFFLSENQKEQIRDLFELKSILPKATRKQLWVEVSNAFKNYKSEFVIEQSGVYNLKLNTENIVPFIKSVTFYLIDNVETIQVNVNNFLTILLDVITDGVFQQPEIEQEKQKFFEKIDELVADVKQNRDLLKSELETSMIAVAMLTGMASGSSFNFQWSNKNDISSYSQDIIIKVPIYNVSANVNFKHEASDISEISVAVPTKDIISIIELQERFNKVFAKTTNL